MNKSTNKLNGDAPDSARRQRSPTAWIIGAVFVCAVGILAVWSLTGNSHLGNTAHPNTGGQQSTSGSAPAAPSGAPPASTTR